MTNDEIIKANMEGGERRCLWQIVPKELPKDLAPMALEMWQSEDGALHLFQLFTEDRNDNEWYRHLTGFGHFVQK